MVKESLSLREIGRRLDIPPSTISYYKDRFARFIPVASGQGRRVKYPPEAVMLFKEIREMFTRNWSAEQVEEQLSTMRHVVTGLTVDGLAAQSGGDPAQAKAFVQDLAGVLDKMSSLLEVQAHFRSEIESLRNEVEQLRREKTELVGLYEARILALGEEMERFRRDRAEASGMRHESGADSAMPDATFLARPLVVKVAGEYLGVAGKGKPFSLQDLIGLIRRNAGSQKVVSITWQETEGRWTLQIRTQDETVRGHAYRLSVFSTVTPSGNAVTELGEMTVDDEIVPDKFVLMLFKNVKEGLER